MALHLLTQRAHHVRLPCRAEMERGCVCGGIPIAANDATPSGQNADQENVILREEKPLAIWEQRPVRPSRRGQFWIPGERVTVEGHTYQHGAMFVSWEAPEHVTKPYPLVLIHGGAMQGTEWLDTPDGRPGWAQRFVEAGYAVFVVDRPTQGRSPFSPEVMGKIGPAFAYEEGEEVFFPAKTLAQHTQWIFQGRRC